jgi:predicted TIM-barrel fold metal-dependent hydrolase
MRLADYRPRSRLRTTTTPVPRPRFPAIDAHNHLGMAFGGDRPVRSAGELAEALDAAGLDAIVDLDGRWGEALRAEIDRWQRPLPGRVAVFAGLDYDRWAEDPAFGETEAARLRDGVAAGARGLKVWKTLGLRARDPGGRLVPVDDARLDPLWATAGELGVPVTIHVADPIAFFDPLDETNERWEELQGHPDWHFWPTRPPGRVDEPGFPPFDELIDGLESLVARHPSTTFIGAHVGCAAEDLARVDRMLEAYPNWNVDIAARIAELGRQPRRTRELFERWPDRILFGVDSGLDTAFYAVHFRFLETLDESFPYDVDDGEPPTQGRWAIHGLGLRDEILRQVYRDNARRLIAFD